MGNTQRLKANTLNQMRSFQDFSIIKNRHRFDTEISQNRISSTDMYLLDYSFETTPSVAKRGGAWRAGERINISNFILKVSEMRMGVISLYEDMEIRVSSFLRNSGDPETNLF